MRILVAELAAGRLVVRGPGFHHLVHVLRARKGDAVVLFDGVGREAAATIDDIATDAVVLRAGEPRLAARASVDLVLLLGLLKGAKMDLVVQKATELGVVRLVPMATAHAVVRLGGAQAEARRARWEKIAAEAARQCGRADVPEIVAPLPLVDALAAAPAGSLRLFFHEKETVPLRPLLEPPPRGTVVAAVGPEGGFADAEVEAARAAGFSVVSLGRRVLRAETAAIAVLAVLGYAGEPGAPDARGDG